MKIENEIMQIFGLLLMTSLLGCEAIPVFHQHPYIDVKLIGVWKGEYVEKDGTTKSWKQTRNADGTYIINYSFIETDGVPSHFTESGRWWIQSSLFHEFALPDMKHPDKYKYSFTSKECVNFTLVESAVDYIFTECLIADSPSTTISNEST
jgi:hypothetical protein